MLEAPLAPYLLWAKSRDPAPIDLAGSNLQPCAIDDLPGAREALAIRAANDNGYRPLVEAIAAHYGIAESRVVSGTGCSGANFVAIAGLVGPGDEVLVEQPGYDPLVGASRLMGATIRYFARRFEDGYQLDVDRLAASVTPRTRLVIVTTPHNPTGCRIDEADLLALGALMAPRGWVLVDEVYLDGANLVAGRPATEGSAARLDGPFIVTSSLTKSYGLAGLKCGWSIASPMNAERLRRTRDVVENAGSAPADTLGVLAFTHLPKLAERTRRLLGRNVTLAREFFAGDHGLALAAAPEASVVFPRIIDPADADGDDFAERLLTRHGVAVAPGSFFGSAAHVRISLAGDSDSLALGFTKLTRL
ncbi:MAG TPA: pyridoxal phosphate-dependent aminotransferase [Vicinamibacterales bacterium]|nr:pyridoxal phosphate-dependent aminotransferase [Vicinamibacterales bacterium]